MSPVMLVEEVNDMGKWKLKSSPKCGGDLFVDRDYNGWYVQCLQCGYMGELEDITHLKEQTATGEREHAPVGRHN
jgi:hypothetical protein